MQNQESTKGVELKVIKPEIGFKFEANGKKYIIEDKLSIARAIEASKIELEMFDITPVSLKNTLTLAYNDLNGNNAEKTIKYADAAVKIHNLVNRIDKGFKLEENPIMRYASLFINEESEDRRTINNAMISEKINDWVSEGIESSGFFLLILNVLPSAKKEFVKLTESISQNPSKEVM